MSDASGIVVLDGQTGIHFTTHPTLALNLTLSHGSNLLTTTHDVEIKITDITRTKIRRGDDVRLLFNHKAYYVVIDADDRFVGFYSGSQKDACLPAGCKFKRW